MLQVSDLCVVTVLNMKLFYVITLILFALGVNCVPFAENCEGPPEVKDAYVVNSNQKGPLYPVGTTIYYRCERGYGLVGDPRVHCLLSRGVLIWSTVKFSCIPSICENPEKPDNGQVVGTEYSLGMVITYECNHGYEMWSTDGEESISSPPLRMCMMDGKWNGEVPQCKPITCPEPENTANGWFSKPSVLTYMTRVDYACFYEYELMGEATRWCSASGEWSGETPICEKIVTTTTAQHIQTIGNSFNIDEDGNDSSSNRSDDAEPENVFWRFVSWVGKKVKAVKKKIKETFNLN